jgi:hypothetical protein
MLDPTTLSALAATAVTALVPLLKTAAEKGAEKLGENAATRLFDGLKAKLASAPAKEALDDAARNPDDADVQAALRMQVRKALEADPKFAATLRGWLAETGAPVGGGTVQTATASGDFSSVVQIHGNRNTVR